MTVLNCRFCLAFDRVQKTTTGFGDTRSGRYVIRMTGFAITINLFDFATIAEGSAAAFGTHGLVLAVYANRRAATLFAHMPLTIVLAKYDAVTLATMRATFVVHTDAGAATLVTVVALLAVFAIQGATVTATAFYDSMRTDLATIALLAARPRTTVWTNMSTVTDATATLVTVVLTSSFSSTRSAIVDQSVVNTTLSFFLCPV